MCANRPRQQLTSLYTDNARRLERSLCRRFPGTCRARVEDAIADTLLLALAHPATLEQLTRRDGEDYRRLYVIAWRNLRGQLRRHDLCRCSPMPEAGDAADPASRDLSPEALMMEMEFAATLHRSIAWIALAHGGRRPERLAAALEARLFEELTDTEASQRFDLPREFVNRGKAELRRTLSKAA